MISPPGVYEVAAGSAVAPLSSKSQIKGVLFKKIIMARRNQRFFVTGVVAPVLVILFTLILCVLFQKVLEDAAPVSDSLITSTPTPLNFYGYGSSAVMPFVNNTGGSIDYLLSAIVAHTYYPTMEFSSVTAVNDFIMNSNNTADFVVGIEVSRGSDGSNLAINLMYSEYDDGYLDDFLNLIDNVLLSVNFQPSSLHSSSAFPNANATTPFLTGYLNTFPYYQKVFKVDAMSSVAPLMLSLATAYTGLAFLQEIVREKEKGTRDQMTMMGLRVVNYWIGTFVADVALVWSASCLCIILAAAFGVAFIVENTFLSYFLLFLLSGVNQVLFSYLLSFLFDKSETAARYAGGMYSILIVVPSMIFTMVPMKAAVANSIQLVLSLLPPYQLRYGISLLVTAQFNETPYTMSTLFAPAHYLGPLIILMVFVCAALSATVVALDRARRLELTLFQYLNPRRVRKFTLDASEQVVTDNDVVAEAARLAALGPSGDANDALVLKGVTKHFVGTNGKVKWANKGVSLGIPKGVCFGLLGPNGAGKTTLLRILTGMQAPTSGTAYVVGLDTRVALDDIYTHIGVVPQHDALFDELTVEEHLKLYSLIRGMTPEAAQVQSDLVLDKMNLREFLKRKAVALSGGTQRKLSVAIALLAKPKILFLDEPTTGMDPGTRRYLWDVVRDSVRGGSTVVLTTHSMEEADALCDNIAILVDGKLRCLGSSLRLKTVYGAGFKVTLQAARGKADSVQAWMTTKFTTSKLSGVVGSSSVFDVPTANYSLGDIFTELAGCPEDVGMESYSVSQTTLDQIFIQFAKEQVSIDDASRLGQ